MPSTTSVHVWSSAALLAVLAAALYAINLGRLPHPDELYHLLAAEGILQTGEPTIGDNGRYWRGYPFTWLVAQSIDLFGTSLSVARLPAVVFMVATVVALFLFIRREAGPLAAWLGALLFATSPFAVDTAQFVRFYSPQCLAFLLGAWLFYELMRADWRWRQLPWAVLALALLAVATYLQPTTLIGLVGLGIWVGMAVLVRVQRSTLPRSRKRLLIGGLIGLGLLVLAAAAASGVLTSLWHSFRWSPLFLESRADEFWFYLFVYFILYPTLLTLSGLLALFALRRNWQLTSFLATIFLTSLVLSSLAGAKNIRYMAYAQPFLFALWGVGIASFVELGRDTISRLVTGLQDLLGESARHMRRPLAHLAVGLALGSVVLANPAWLRSATLLADVTLPGQTPPTDWAAAQPTLQPWLDTAEIVVATEELGPLFYYDRVDLMLSATKFAELPAASRAPFAPDYRTDVPTIATAEDLQLVMDCRSEGLFLTQAKHWGPRAERLRDPAVEELLLSRAHQLELPVDSHILAFVWTNTAAAADEPACSLVPTIG